MLSSHGNSRDVSNVLMWNHLQDTRHKGPCRPVCGVCYPWGEVMEGIIFTICHGRGRFLYTVAWLCLESFCKVSSGRGHRCWEGTLLSVSLEFWIMGICYLFKIILKLWYFFFLKKEKRRGKWHHKGRGERPSMLCFVVARAKPARPGGAHHALHPSPQLSQQPCSQIVRAWIVLRGAPPPPNRDCFSCGFSGFSFEWDTVDCIDTGYEPQQGQGM